MTQTITCHRTQDLASPYADIERLPRLTAEEEARLLHDLRLASHAPAAKKRLIEGYLPRVLTLARQYDRRYSVITFDDLVQEGSLALMGAIDKCATMPLTKSLSCYVGAVVRRAFATDAPIHMPNSTWHYVHDTGRAHEYAWMQTMRLDVARNADGETFSETLVAPAPPPPVDEQQQGEYCCLLVRLLATLSERRRQVLTLRYGLDPADARSHSRAETARLLGLSPGAVYDAEQRAIATLRHAYRAHVADSTPAGGLTEALAQASPPADTAGQQQYHQRQHAEQQAKLEAAFRSMQEQSLPITSETLKNTAHVDHRAACAFVKQHMPQSAERARIRAIPVQQRLEEAFAQMVAGGDAQHYRSQSRRPYRRARRPRLPAQQGRPPSTRRPTQKSEPSRLCSS